MGSTSIILSIVIGGAGLIIAVTTTIKGFRDAKKSVQQKISKRRLISPGDYHIAE
jgi:hypothetical protein